MKPLTAFSKTMRLISQSPTDFFMAISLVIILGLVELPLPIFMALLIDTLIPSNDQSTLIVIGCFLFVIRAGASGFQVFQNFLVARMATRFSIDLRQRMIHNMIRLPFVKFINGEVNGMITRLIQDVEKFQQFSVETVHFMMRPIFSFIFLMSAMLYWNAFLGFYCMLIVPSVVLLTRGIRKHMEENARKARRRLEALEVDAGEAFSNIRNIKAFCAEDNFTQRIGERIEHIEEASIRHAAWDATAMHIIHLINATNRLGFIFFAALQVFDGNITIGGFVALEQMSAGIRSPIAQIMYYFTSIKSRAVAIERTDSVLDEPNEHRGHHVANPDLVLKGKIQFDNVHLSFPPSIKVIDELNLTITAGEMVALVGPSGAGKSSLANLLLSLYNPTAGRITVDGHDINIMALKDLRRHLGVVYQDAILFNNSIRYNLRVGDPDASDEQIWAALALANAKTFVERLPKQLDTVIGVNGIKLSGGQKQRLSIARAILPNPTIMILDEATSSLDSSSELEIQKGLDQALQGRTSIIIAHRLSTIVKADRILVMEKGRIVEEGNHASLIAKEQGLYYDLYRTQVDGFER